MGFNLFEDHFGVSPVVGVILMVAITVILAVTVGFVVLDLGGSTSQNARAGVSMEETSDGVQVTLDNLGGNTERLEVLVNGSPVDGAVLTSAGDSVTIGVSAESTVSVRGTTESGESSVIRSITADSDTSSSGSPVLRGQFDTSPSVSELEEAYEEMEVTGSGAKVITNIYELQAVNQNLTGNYVLGNDIDASVTKSWDDGAGFTPIGENYSVSFTGSLDGRGYEVRDLTINRSSGTYVGLFGVSGGDINDIGVVNAEITGESLVGVLAGLSEGNVVNSYADGSVDGNDNLGGLLGNSGSGSVENSYASVSVTGEGSVGGLVGVTYWNNSISNSYATGDVTATSDETAGSNIGGLVGVLGSGSVENSYASGNVNGLHKVGGLVGLSSGSITKSYATGDVTGETSSDSGGVIGFNENTGTISDSYWDTSIVSTGIGENNASSTDVDLIGLTTSEMQGSNAETNMGALDFGGVWTTVSGDYPELAWQE